MWCVYLIFSTKWLSHFNIQCFLCMVWGGRSFEGDCIYTCWVLALYHITFSPQASPGFRHMHMYFLVSKFLHHLMKFLHLTWALWLFLSHVFFLFPFVGTKLYVKILYLHLGMDVWTLNSVNGLQTFILWVFKTNKQTKTITEKT